MADVLTKWHRGNDLESDGVWFTGAPFLHQPKDQWPTMEVTIEETYEEARGHVTFHGVVEVDRCSRWTTLQRVMACAVRFIDNCKRKVAGLPIVTLKATDNQQHQILVPMQSMQRPLERDEFRTAQIILWKQAQFEGFPDEMSILTKNLEQQPDVVMETVKKSSCLYKLTPILDKEGVLRLGGRMDMSVDMPFDKRCPIILPRKHATTEKLIQFYHEKYGHANRETVMNELRQRFWIPNTRAAIRQVMSNCVLHTTLAEAEDMINARPLTYIPQESAEEEAITPNHFLRGSVTSADLVVQPVDIAEALRDTYKRSQYLANRMWERWCKEYLPTINRRTKWFEEQKPLQVNDLVFIVDGKTRKSWIRGIVEEILRGPDGRVRQAIVRTARGVYRRAVANLAVMEV
ncbi:uncharacterized protein LOC135697298 [Ochlerotatus camptorhynchus]